MLQKVGLNVLNLMVVHVKTEILDISVKRPNVLMSTHYHRLILINIIS